MTDKTTLELQRFRDSIDNIDAALIHLLAERFKCTKRVGEFKAAKGLPPADPERERRQITRLRTVKDDKTALLLKCNMGAGHGGASGRYDRLHEQAFQYAWLLSQVR